MPYGQGTKIGEGYNPAIGLYDYSPLMRANEISSNTMANSISGVIRDVSDERKKNKQQITASKQTAKAIAQLIPELQPVLDEQIAMMDDEEMPLSQRAGVASAITDILNLGTAEIKGRAMLGLEAKRLQLMEMDTMSTVNARNAGTTLDIESARAFGEVGSFNLGSAINVAKDNPRMAKATGISAKDLEQAKDLSAPAQAAIAESYFARLPKEEQAKYINDFPVNVGGTNAKLPGVVQGNTFYPAQIAGDLAPPDGIMPDGSPLDTSGVTVDGLPGVLPPRITPGNIQGQDPMSPTEKIAVQKYQDEQVAKQQAVGATAAKSERMFALLDQLDKHPGFSGLFGFGVGSRKIPGTDAAGAETLFKQIDAMGFIEAIKDMKGMGALSNAEGEKVSAALVGMDPKMPEKEARAKIAEIKAYISAGMQRMQTGNLVNPDGTPKTRDATPTEIRTNATSRLRGLPK